MMTKLLKGLVIVPVVATLLPALPARADMRNFTMVNDSSDSILSLHVSSVSNESWEDDILGVDTMAPDTNVAVTFDSSVSGRCMYDVKAMTLSGEDVIASGVNLCTTSKIIYDGTTLVAR